MDGIRDTITDDMFGDVNFGDEENSIIGSLSADSSSSNSSENLFDDDELDELSNELFGDAGDEQSDDDEEQEEYSEEDNEHFESGDEQEETEEYSEDDEEQEQGDSGDNLGFGISDSEFGDIDFVDDENDSNSTNFENDESDTDDMNFDSVDTGLDGIRFDSDDTIIDGDVGEELNTSDEEIDPAEYADGAMVDENELLNDDEEYTDNSDFISDSGAIVVQESRDEKEIGFELRYVSIEKIAITNRIRKMESVEGLVQSIKSTGLLKPLVVAPTATDGLYVLLDGYRRIQACARAGLTRLPCIVNNKVSTPEIPILEAMYNHAKMYTIKEQIDYIDYLEKQKGIMNPMMIEYLLQMDSGDYTKLKDILMDNDEDIVTKLFNGQYTIATAFKKLEQRRRKESNAEKENKKAAKVYGNEEETGADQIEGSGDSADGVALSDEQIQKLAFNVNELEDNVEDISLSEIIDSDNNLEGFEPHKQNVGEREYIDPIIRKTVMARDKATCRCCKRGGQQYVDILDFHHIIPVFLGGSDTPENGIMLCVACHRLVHLYSTGDLHIDSALLNNDYDELDTEQKERYENRQIFEDEQRRFKTIIYLGSKIRQGIAQKGMNKEQFKKEHPNTGIGRRKPGVNAQQEKA